MRDLPGTIASLSKRLSDLAADHETVTAHGGDPITIGKRRPARDDVAPALAAQLDAMPMSIREKTRVPLGTYRGLRFGMVLNPQWSPEVYLEGAITRFDTLSRDHHGPRAVLNGLDRLASGYASECARVQQDLAIAEAQLRDYQARLQIAFSHDAYLTELTNLRDQLKAGLSATAHHSDDEEGPSASDLAEKIKALKAANTIEPTPQRARHKQSTAEEPVTTRIRRRHDGNSDGNRAVEPGASSVPSDDALNRDPTRRPPMSHQERVVTRHDDGSSWPSL